MQRVACEKCSGEGGNHVNGNQQKFQREQISEVVIEQVGFLCHAAVIKVADAKIQQHRWQHGKIQQNEINSVIGGAHLVLHSAVDTEYPKRFYEQVYKDKKSQVGNKAPLHTIRQNK